MKRLEYAAKILGDRVYKSAEVFKTLFDPNGPDKGDYLANDYVDGVTFSGGDPLEDCNIEAFTDLAKQIKDRFGDTKDIWVYTGYTYEEVKDKEIFNFVDVLVDGPFELDKRDITLAFRGSSNQRIIDIKKGCSI